MVPPVVDVTWLEEHRDDVVLADVRWALGGPPGADAFAAGHLPGAVFVDLDADLAAPASAAAGRHPLPEPPAFAAAMSRLGIGDDSVVVAYDDSAGSSAARLVWMLRALGVEAALLDGGLRAWPGELEQGTASAERRTFTARPWPVDRVVDADAVAAAVASGVPVLDARDPGRFTGEAPVPADPRPGHVPGAVNAPWKANLGADGALLPADELRERYAALGAHDGAGAVLYCGSGVTACLDLLALERAGVTDARLYPGSWSQWGADETRPVATGEAPTR